MDCTSAFEKIDQLFPSYVSLWEDICNIESPTDYKEGVDQVGAFLIRWAQARNWAIELAPQTKSGDAVCITMNPNCSAQPLSLSGHMDTVHPVGSFGSPAVSFEDDKIVGPGVADCKGGIVAALLAMDALQSVGYTLRPVQLILQSDEEVGSSYSNLDTVRFMCDKAKNAVAFLNLEGFNQGKACIARKGIINFEFTVTGQEAHAAECATQGANAIIEAAHKMLLLDKIKDPEGLTCSCGVIRGGSVSNTVPKECVFRVNVRFATKEQEAWICKYVQEVAEKVHVPGCTCKVEIVSHRIAMELSDTNTQLLERMNGIFVQYGMPQLVGTKNKGGSDAAYVTNAGIPCIDNLGVEGKRIHNPEEYALIESLRESARRIAAIAYHI